MINQIVVSMYIALRGVTIIFQIKRYEYCFGYSANGEYKSTIYKYFFPSFTVFVVAVMVAQVGVFWMMSRNVIVHNSYCTWTLVTPILSLVSGIVFFVIDLFVLALFSRKILSLSYKLKQYEIKMYMSSNNNNNNNNNDNNNKNNKHKSKNNYNQSLTNNTKKLYSILKRLLILSLFMEITYMMNAGVNTLFSGSKSALTWQQTIVIIVNYIDILTNIKFLTLMLQHNTKFRYILISVNTC